MREIRGDSVHWRRVQPAAARGQAPRTGPHEHLQYRTQVQLLLHDFLLYIQGFLLWILGYAVIWKQLLFANKRNRVRWVVLGLSQDGSCTDLSENFSEDSLKGDLSNDNFVSPLLFSLVNTFKVLILNLAQYGTPTSATWRRQRRLMVLFFILALYGTPTSATWKRQRRLMVLFF